MCGDTTIRKMNKELVPWLGRGANMETCLRKRGQEEPDLDEVGRGGCSSSTCLISWLPTKLQQPECWKNSHSKAGMQREVSIGKVSMSTVPTDNGTL